MPVEYVCVNLGVYLKSFFIAYILVFIFYIVRISYVLFLFIFYYGVSASCSLYRMCIMHISEHNTRKRNMDGWMDGRMDILCIIFM